MTRLLNRGANINAKAAANFSETPLHFAASNGHAEVAKILIERGANVNSQTSNLTAYHGGPLLWLHRHRPCDEESKKIARMLIEAGADVNQPGISRTTLEYWAKDEAPCSREVTAMLRDADNIRKEAAARRAKAQAEKERGREIQRELAQSGSAIEAAEKAADAAAAAGDNAKAVAGYLEALKKCPAGSEPETRVREKLIRSAAIAPPAVPEEARHMSQRAQAFIKFAQDSTGFAKAAAELEGALRLAPWWPEAYFNMGLVQEKLGAPAEAARNLKLYLLAEPGASDAENVRRKLVELEVQQELKQTAAD